MSNETTGSAKIELKIIKNGIGYISESFVAGYIDKTNAELDSLKSTNAKLVEFIDRSSLFLFGKEPELHKEARQLLAEIEGSGK